MPRTRRCSTRPSPRRRRSPAIAATSTASRPISPRRATSAIISTPSRRSSRPSRCPAGPGRLRVSSGSVWEPIAGYSRAVRVKDTIRVSGTTATHGGDRCVAPGDAGAQTTYILDKIAASISALGGTMEDVVRTRIYLRDAAKWEPVVARPWPRVRRDHAGQHADRGRRPDRRLRGRDRGGSGGFAKIDGLG